MTTSSIKPVHPLSLDQPAYYWIEIQGQLDVYWSTNFSGMVLSVGTIPGDGKKTILQGMVADQATLHGILNSIRDLGLPLLKVEYLPVVEADV